jgi:malic enzyme
LTSASAATNPTRAAVEGQQHLLPPLAQLEVAVAVAAAVVAAAAVAVAAVAAVVDSKLLLKFREVRFLNSAKCSDE